MQDLGADFTVKHGEPLQSQLKALGIDGVDYVMHCWDAESLWEELGTIVNPLGHICIIATTVEQLAMKQFWYKGISVSWELMFTRSMFGTNDIHVQRDILNKAAELLESGTFKPRMTKCYEWADLLEAHKLVESGKAVGKIAVRLP